LDKLLDMQADLLRALGHPTRLRIIRLLGRGERCVCEIVPALNLEQPNVSKHLAQLKSAGLVTSRKEGLKVIYRLRNPEILEILDILRDILVSNLKEDQVFLQSLGEADV